MGSNSNLWTIGNKTKYQLKGSARYGKIHVYSHVTRRQIFYRPNPAICTGSTTGPTVKGYRSFANLAEGKAVCVMEAPDKEAVASWFKKMGMPFDTITKVELEGDRGTIQAA